jgi:hypothetical protein
MTVGSGHSTKAWTGSCQAAQNRASQSAPDVRLPTMTVGGAGRENSTRWPFGISQPNTRIFKFEVTGIGARISELRERRVTEDVAKQCKITSWLESQHTGCESCDLINKLQATPRPRLRSCTQISHFAIRWSLCSTPLQTSRARRCSESSALSFVQKSNGGVAPSVMK